MNSGEPAILLVEDNPVDVTLLRRAFKDLGITTRLVALSDGAQAIQYLGGEGSYSNRAEFPIPRLMLLDLGLPNVDGFEVIRWLRNQPALRHLPVIVLSGSAFSPDVKRAYAAGANSFLSKPGSLAELTASIKSLMDFWLDRCSLPDSSPAPTQPAISLPQSPPDVQAAAAAPPSPPL